MQLPCVLTLPPTLRTAAKMIVDITAVGDEQLGEGGVGQGSLLIAASNSEVYRELCSLLVDPHRGQRMSV